MLQFDDSCYVDAKQYHLASFSTRNSTLNTSLRKPIRMQDFIQLCDSTVYLIMNPGRNFSVFKTALEVLVLTFKGNLYWTPIVSVPGHATSGGETHTSNG